MAAKFKVGDRVVPSVWLAEFAFSNDAAARTVVEVRDSRHGQQIRVAGADDWSHYDHFTPATTSPIRTVTRREIVPGVYGRIKTADIGDVGPSGERIPVSVERRFYDADDLRELAHLFNQIAEVLEENTAAEMKEAA